MKRRRGSIVLVGAVVLAGCGASGPSDKEAIASIVRSEGAKPATLCNHLTGSVLAQLGGRGSCLQQASSAAPDRTTHATSIRVRGKTATAVEVDRAGAHTISLVKQKGVWKVSAVLGPVTG